MVVMSWEAIWALDFSMDVASGYDVGGDDPDGFVVEFGGSQFVG